MRDADRFEKKSNINRKGLDGNFDEQLRIFLHVKFDEYNYGGQMRADGTSVSSREWVVLYKDERTLRDLMRTSNFFFSLLYVVAPPTIKSALARGQSVNIGL